MNVNFSGGAEKTPERATSPPRTLSFIRVSVRSWESFVNPGKRPRQPGRAHGQFGIIWLVTGKVSPRNLEFHPGFRPIQESFRGSWKPPLTAWLAKGNPLGPKK